MLRKIINTLVVLPLAIVLIVFAVANRHVVTLSFDPFDATDPALGLRLPLFVVIIVFAMLGVFVGGVVVWFGQRRWRRGARHQEAEAQRARAQLASLQGHSQNFGEFAETRVTAVRGDSRLAGKSPQDGAIGQDNPGPTL